MDQFKEFLDIAKDVPFATTYLKLNTTSFKSLYYLAEVKMGGAAGVDVSNWSKVDSKLAKENAREYFGDKISMGTVLQTFHERKSPYIGFFLHQSFRFHII